MRGCRTGREAGLFSSGGKGHTSLGNSGLGGDPQWGASLEHREGREGGRRERRKKRKEERKKKKKETNQKSEHLLPTATCR